MSNHTLTTVLILWISFSSLSSNAQSTDGPLVLIPESHFAATKLTKLEQQSIELNGASFKLVPLAETTKSTEQFLENYVIPSINLADTSLDDSLNFLRSMATQIEKEGSPIMLKIVTQNIPEAAEKKINFKAEKINLKTTLENIAIQIDATIEVEAYVVKLIGKNEAPKNYTFSDFKGNWVSLPFSEMAKEDIPLLIKEIKAGNHPFPSEIGEQELEKFKTMNEEEITKQFFTPVLQLLDRVDMRMHIEIAPPKNVWFTMEARGEKTPSYGYDDAEFEMQADRSEFHIRAGNDITIFRIIDRDTIQSPNDKAGSIPRWITLKRVKN